jgi:hypothetical protein
MRAVGPEPRPTSVLYETSVRGAYQSATRFNAFAISAWELIPMTLADACGMTESRAIPQASRPCALAEQLLGVHG